MYGLMKGGPEINVQNCVHFMARGTELGYHPTLAPHQLALAMISVWNAEVADLNARRKSGRAIGPLFAEVGFRLRILDDDGRLGGAILSTSESPASSPPPNVGGERQQAPLFGDPARPAPRSGLRPGPRWRREFRNEDRAWVGAVGRHGSSSARQPSVGRRGELVCAPSKPRDRVGIDAHQSQA